MVRTYLKERQNFRRQLFIFFEKKSASTVLRLYWDIVQYRTVLTIRVTSICKWLMAVSHVGNSDAKFPKNDAKDLDFPISPYFQHVQILIGFSNA